MEDHDEKWVNSSFLMSTWWLVKLVLIKILGKVGSFMHKQISQQRQKLRYKPSAPLLGEVFAQGFVPLLVGHSEGKGRIDLAPASNFLYTKHAPIKFLWLVLSWPTWQAEKNRAQSPAYVSQSSLLHMEPSSRMQQIRRDSVAAPNLAGSQFRQLAFPKLEAL